MTKQIFCALGILFACVAQAQVPPGQIDTFDADTMSWQGANPTWISGGGPGGAGDAYLQIHSTGGGGPASKPACYNNNQWTGDFSGLGSIGVDFKNSGTTDLVLRLVFFDANVSTQWVSLSTATMAAGAGWQHFTFSLNAANFTRTEGTSSFADTITAANRMMFRHNVTPGDGGVAQVSTFGVDNVRANPVPEPATLLGLSFAFPWLLRRRRT